MAVGCPIGANARESCCAERRIGGVLNGSSVQSRRSRYVKRFMRSMETMFDSDQPAFDRWCSHLRRSMEIRAVQIWTISAFCLCQCMI